MNKSLALSHNEQRFGLSGLDLELDNFINYSKDNIKSKASQITLAVTDGYVDPIDALIFTKKLSELAKELDTKIRPIAESKPIGKEYQKFGVSIIEKMNGVSYNFETCNDPIYEKLNRDFENAKAELDARKDLLKTVTKNVEMYDPETSEVFVCKPPVKNGKLGFTLTIK